MERFHPELWVLLSGHSMQGFTYVRMDRQMDGVKPIYPSPNFLVYGYDKWLDGWVNNEWMNEWMNKTYSNQRVTVKPLY